MSEHGHERFEERERRDDWQWVHERLLRLERKMREVMATQADLAQKINDVSAGVDRLIAEVQAQPLTQAELDAAVANLDAVNSKLPKPAPAPAVAPVEPAPAKQVPPADAPPQA